MAQTPEESDYTAIQQRILEQDPIIADRHTDAFEKLPEDLQTAIGKLMPFGDQKADNPERAIPYEIKDYLELVDWSARAVIEGKCGSIPDKLPPILARLKIDPAAHVKFINRSEKARIAGGATAGRRLDKSSYSMGVHVIPSLAQLVCERDAAFRSVWRRTGYDGIQPIAVALVLDTRWKIMVRILEPDRSGSGRSQAERRRFPAARLGQVGRVPFNDGNAKKLEAQGLILGCGPA